MYTPFFNVYMYMYMYKSEITGLSLPPRAVQLFFFEISYLP